ncbi:hypothetical protein AMEX_G4596 [Astyanax mexicanus]|uniref:Uncharacterized protein n=1 Tax=Astyanax mexicanus TaxID=7994 RepID=A0A8T2M7G6_ASTMX|nr:hypothetical protein AMEX_G4596 [Astyanax mexicanus]
MKLFQICNITRPYSEVCFSGCCTYKYPPAFLDHLMNKQCEATWYTPDMTSLADPSQPQNLSGSVINVTLQSLITKQHVDGLFLNINCHDTNKRYQAVYRVSGSPPGAPPPDQSRQSSIVSVAVGSVAGFAILAAVAALIYCREQIRRQICGSENPGEEGIELRGQGGGEPRVEEEEV